MPLKTGWLAWDNTAESVNVKAKVSKAASQQSIFYIRFGVMPSYE